MNDPCDPRTTRRGFLRGLWRLAALAGLGAGASWLIGRRLAVPWEQRCINRGLCRGCPVFGGCGLPKARLTRAGVKKS